jgi:hypothetical protein
LISLLENGTWKEVVPPKDVNLVSTKWVYHIKTEADGIIERFKAVSSLAVSVKSTAKITLRPLHLLFEWTLYGCS